MRLPFINTISRTRKQQGVFAGLDTRDVIQEAFFSDMKNMTSDYYPAIAPRKGRGRADRNIEKPNGLYWKNGLLIIDGTKVTYDGTNVGEVQDGKKSVVGMGAYLLIFPDKKYLNTSTKEFGNLETEFIQSSSASFAPTYTGSTYVKITCTGIGRKFNQWDGVELSGCIKEDFNKTATIQAKTEDSITVIGAITEAFTQASGLSVRRKVPEMDFIVECENRIWGCSSKSHEIYACKLGDPFNWNAFEGISTDSYAATVGSDGDFTGIGKYAGYTLFFKENTIHKVYGNKPSNIQVTTQETFGVGKGCEQTVCLVGDKLIYQSVDGIYGYSGGMPYKVSEALNGIELSKSVAGKYKNKYYLSTDGGLYVYDAEKKLWHKEDGEKFTICSNGGGELYYVNQDGELKTVEGETEDIDWMIESGDLEESSLNKKYVGKLQFMMEMERGAKIEIFMKFDDAPWKRMISITAGRKKTYTIPLKATRCFRYRWKIEGKGMAKLFAVGKFLEEGSEI